VTGTRVATVRRDVPSDRQHAKPGLSVPTLTIASLSSLAAALVVSKIWGGGTLIGAAMTPVIVAVVSEGLRRPATVITSVRDTRSARFDPLAEGRAGLREGDLERARSAMPAAAVAERRVHRTSGGGGFSLRMPRPRVIAAVMTGLVAFALVGVLLTGSELVLGKSVVSSSKRTTFVPVHRSTSTTKTTTTDTTPTTSTSTTAAPEATTPPSTETTPTVAPTVTAAPQTTTPAPQTTQPPAATAPAPAPQSAAPPATTTP
jgi:hypothetical protein